MEILVVIGIIVITIISAVLYNYGDEKIGTDKTNDSACKSKLSITNIICRIVVILLSFKASHTVYSAGCELSEIQSRGGDTIMESFYNDIGDVCKGLSLLIVGIGVYMYVRISMHKK